MKNTEICRDIGRGTEMNFASLEGRRWEGAAGARAKEGGDGRGGLREGEGMVFRAGFGKWIF